MIDAVYQICLIEREFCWCNRKRKARTLERENMSLSLINIRSEKWKIIIVCFCLSSVCQQDNISEEKKKIPNFSLSLGLDTLEPEQFTYEIVIPRSLRSSRSFSIVPDWKARLRDETPIEFDSINRPKRSSKSSFVEHSNHTLYYRIHAFNRTFDLSLHEEDTFLAPSFVIQHFDHNRTWLTKDIQHCFYKGYVNQNLLSTVSISLCHGLVCMTFASNEIVRKKKHLQMNPYKCVSKKPFNDLFFSVRNVCRQWYGIFYWTSIRS